MKNAPTETVISLTLQTVEEYVPVALMHKMLSQKLSKLKKRALKSIKLYLMSFLYTRGATLILLINLPKL